jgi:glycosyltransferase involved in cell wall biosynthesis
VLNVNRNQIRKDYTKTFASFKLLKEKVPNAFLLVLAQIQDQGGDLQQIASYFGLEFGVDWMAPSDYTANKGYPVEMVNLIYNIADVVFSSTVGEGFGLSSIEAMAVGKPCVFPDNTSLTEIFSGDTEETYRGLLIDSGEDLDHLISYGGLDSSLVRPTINTYVASEHLAWVYNNKEEVALMVTRAQEWAMSHSWNLVNRYWVERFAHVYNEVLRKRA